MSRNRSLVFSLLALTVSVVFFVVPTKANAGFCSDPTYGSPINCNKDDKTGKSDPNYPTCESLGGFCMNRVCQCGTDPGICPAPGGFSGNGCPLSQYCNFSGAGTCGGHTVSVSGGTVHVTDCRCIAGYAGGCISYCNNTPPVCNPVAGSVCYSAPNSCGMKGTGTMSITCVCSATIPSDALCGSPPIGALESSTLQNNCTALGGWSFDPDYAGSIAVHVYVNGAFYTALTANGSRPDVGAIYPGHTNSGYSFSTAGWHDGLARSVISYGINVDAAGTVTGGPNPALSGTPVNLTCPPPPTLTLTAAPTPVNQGSTSVVSWTTTNAVSCTSSAGDGGWPGARPVSGNYVTGALMSPTTFTLTCANAVGDTAVKSVTVGVNALPPVSTIKSIAQPDYCTSVPAAIVTWTYSSVPGFPRKNWQLQIANDAGFTSLAYDTGVLSLSPVNRSLWSGMWHAVAGFLGLDAQAAAIIQDYTYTAAQGSLFYNRTYYVRVRAWDTVNAAPGAWSAGMSFATPSSQYPSVSFTVTPAKPVAKQPTTFTDTTQYNGSSPLTRTWNFGDGTIVTENAPITGNTIEHTYQDTASVTVTLSVRTAPMPPGKTCSATTSFGVSKAIPIFKEVRP